MSKSDNKFSNLRPTRRELMLGSGTLALGAALPGLGLFNPNRACAAGLANGMTGGPISFEGSELYQYNASMSEGRAIAGIKQLQANGKAPMKLTLLYVASCVPQLVNAPPGGGESVKETWERETGITLEVVGVEAGEIWKKVLQDITTGDGSYDLYTHSWNSVGDLVSANGAYNLDSFVERYQPDWGDPQRGTPTPQIRELLYKYNGSNYCASLDGDFVVWQYRKDLMADENHRKAFKSKFGYDIPAQPTTWDQIDNLSEYFHSQGVGHANLLGPFWGLSNFYARFASMKAPNNFWLDDNGNPTLTTAEGIKAAEAHVRSIQWTSKDNVTWGWAEQYGAIANLKACMAMTFSNMASINDKMKDGQPATPVTGKLAAWEPVGTKVGDKTVRRSVIYFNVTASVAQKSKYPEAAYLFLQYISSTRTFTRICGNPVGGSDPFQLANLDDPNVRKNVHEYMMNPIRETIRRAVPSINFAGQAALDNALDENLQAALAGKITAEQAMVETEKAWKKIIAKRPEEIVKAIRAQRAAWPTVID
jgi:multiple sugar transport system substrate-binding protein